MKISRRWQMVCWALGAALMACSGEEKSGHAPSGGAAGTGGGNAGASGTSGEAGSAGSGAGAGASGSSGAGGSSGAAGSAGAGGSAGASGSGGAGGSAGASGSGGAGGSSGAAGSAGAGGVADCALDDAPCAVGGGSLEGVCCGGTCTSAECCATSGCTARHGQGWVCEQGICQNVVGTLDGLRWEMACSGATSNPLVCVASGASTDSKILGGAAGQAYSVTLRFRGVVEEKTYLGGTKLAYWHEGGTPSADGFNVYKLEISSPPQTYYLNSGVSDSYWCVSLDYTHTVTIAAGATVTLSADPVDLNQIRNVGEDGATPLRVPDVAPYPDAYDGQFIQMDVLSVVPR